jgi:hypothetical protein
MFLRIEHRKTGKGPYVGSNGIVDKSLSEQRPSPEFDMGGRWSLMSIEWQKQYIFGFKNYHQAHDWFSQEERKRLKKNGYVWRWCDATEHIAGQKQVAFIRKSK